MVETYAAALLERGHRVAMQFAQGWVMGEVINYEDAPIPYDQAPGSGGYDSLAANSGSTTMNGGLVPANNWQIWYNSQGQHLFRERDKDKILQAFIGIYPARLRLWKQFPAPITRGNLYEIKVPAVITASAGGYISGEWSPYEEPTTLTEVLVPPELLIAWGVFNPEAVAVYPRFQIIMRRIQMRYFKMNNAKDKQEIEKIVAGGRCKKWSPGLEPFEYDVSDRIGADIIDWTPGVSLNADEEVEAK